jgi:hypothetical protein
MGVTAKVIDWCVGELFSAESESASTGSLAGWLDWFKWLRKWPKVREDGRVQIDQKMVQNKIGWTSAHTSENGPK